jgi:hypothetical protein
MSGVVVHTCNPSYFGDRDRKITVLDQPWSKKKKKIRETLFQRTSQLYSGISL